MPTNKHAVIRYRVIDECLSNFQRRFYIEDLIHCCQDALEYEGYGKESVKRRQIFNDLNFMESVSGYDAPIERIKDGRRVYYRYTDPKFSIKERPWNPQEQQAIKEALSVIQRMDGLAHLSYFKELQAILENSIDREKESRPVISFTNNEFLTGLEHLPKLYRHCFNEQVLNLGYRSFKQESALWRVFHPWYLKQYNSRWFLFGWDEERSAMSNFALDRIEGFSVQYDQEFRKCDINFEEYFDDILGVTKPDEEKVREVKLIFSTQRAPYVRTKPLHPTQKTRVLEDGRLEVRVNLIPNKELTQILWSFGPDLLKVEGIEGFITFPEKDEVTRAESE